ncbi:hypothetical protein AVEN_228035-1 [Araneus ventricosus]|uniref:Glucose-methanol-choline oxidoreductase N-terminal domain-containing protein n=1 Tax=Araneus ventricosus TaxID=182803 RepID=A0A4Y2T1M0_ARAVE|nr:hypothetical protein AVEN_228035-1 [Araneus ventricosus]
MLVAITGHGPKLPEGGTYYHWRGDSCPIILYPQPGARTRLLRRLLIHAHVVPQGGRRKSVIWPCVKIVSSSSVVNALLNLRGTKKDYDDWAAQGATGWSYSEVL